MPLPTLKDVTLVNPVLTDLSIGYQNEALLWDKICPQKGVSYKTGTYPIYTRDYWFRRAQAAVRAEDGGYNRYGYGIGSGTYATVEIGFEKLLGDPTKAANQTGDDLADIDTRFLTTLMELELEKLVANDAFTASKWGTDSTLAGTNQWSDFDGSDPIANIDIALRTIRRNVGTVAKKIGCCGALAWEKLKEHPLVIDKYKHTQKGVMTPELVAAVLGLDEINVGWSVENTAYEKLPGTASFTGADIWTDNFLVRAEGANAMPSMVFIWEEDFKAPWVVENYRDDKVRGDVTRIRTHYDVVIASTQHGYLILDCAA